MGVLERNARNDVGQPLGDAPSADSRRQMDMFEDERQRASWRRHGTITRGVAKRGLVAFLAFVMAFGTTPAQLWAEGAEGIAEAVAQAATSGEGAAADDGVTSDADVTAADDAAENVAIGDDATAGDTANAEGSAAPASVDSEQGDASDSVAAASARSAYVTVDSVEIVDADGNGLAYGSGTAKVGDTVKVAAYYGTIGAMTRRFPRPSTRSWATSGMSAIAGLPRRLHRPLPLSRGQLLASSS